MFVCNGVVIAASCVEGKRSPLGNLQGPSLTAERTVTVVKSPLRSLRGSEQARLPGYLRFYGRLFDAIFLKRLCHSSDTKGSR
jgi:hypothetical protein